jgi:peptidoglycan/xylan/chitin deacetylase (PgdA/CDA1 family)
VFEGTTRSSWLDWLRVPTVQIEGDAGRDVAFVWSANGRTLAWRAVTDVPYERYELDGIPFYARGVAREAPEWGNDWAPVAEVRMGGAAVSSVWQSKDGSIFLPFDPDDAMLALQSEAYITAGGAAAREGAKGFARWAYYRARPFLPRALQLAMRRAFSRVQRRRSFPAWPVEAALHDLSDRLLSFAAAVAGEPLPFLAPWPRQYTWSLVLTHDVETAVGYARIDELCEEEAALGYRSAWNLVPERDYVVEDELIDRLVRDGWEVGVHGLHHDGRDLESERRLAERLPGMRCWAERWSATGFRAPATQRAWSLMPTLGFDYDSSYPDTDPFEPQGGGCCSWLPFFNGDLVELPITMPQDHTLFEILGESDATCWIAKMNVLRERGGMALIDTHPDYLGEDPARSAYLKLLRTFAADSSAWRALPRDVTVWWRRRANTTIQREGSGWCVVGPAEAEAAVDFVPVQAA